MRINGTVYCRDFSRNEHYKSAASLSDCQSSVTLSKLAKTFQVSPAIDGFVISDLAIALHAGRGLTLVRGDSPFNNRVGVAPQPREGWSEFTVVGPGGIYEAICSRERDTYRRRFGIEYYEAEYLPVPAPEDESDQDRTEREMLNAQRQKQADWLRTYFTLTREEIANYEMSDDTDVVDAVIYFNGLDDDIKVDLKDYFSLPEEERSYAAGTCRFTHLHGDPPYRIKFVPYRFLPSEKEAKLISGARLSVEIITSSGGEPNVPPHN